MKVIVLFFISWTLLLGETFKPLTVLIDFPDYRYTDLHRRERELVNQRKGDKFTPELYANMFFDPESYLSYNGKEFISAKKYFTMESGGTYTLEGSEDDIYGWFTAPKSIEFYGKNISEEGDRIRAAHLVRLAVNKLVDKKIDFSQYDRDEDGVIDGLILLYAGKGEHLPNSLGSRAIWPHFNRMQNISSSKFYYFKDHNNNLWKIDKYVFIPQDIPLDLYIHEIGHFLNLSDLYKGESTIGYWSIMGELYCGKILGSKLNSLGGYHRYNLQTKSSNKNIPAFWAGVINYNLNEIIKKDKYIKLHNTNHKKSNNLIKIDLPGKRIDVPAEGRDLYYTDNYLNPDSNITFSVFLPKDTDNVLKFDAWFNSKPEKEIEKVYIRPSGEEHWLLLKNKNSKNNKRGTWIPLEFDLNSFNGKFVEIMVSLVPYKNEGPKGAYIADLMVMSDTIKKFDLKTTQKTFTHDGFIHSFGGDLLKKYILIEYRNPIDKRIDEGLLRTKLNIPYRKGLLIWYIDESYSNSNQLVNILPSNEKMLYEIIDGDLIKLKLKPYIVSSWTFSSIDTKEMGVVGEKRVFYREQIHGSSSFLIKKHLQIKILEENKGDIKLIISYKK
ncbi:immune inhibitor A [Fusobacteria bacterium ZRK30]|nr:immune inhibitor A [Fusobacteria bacterium ZRK30]